MLPRLAHFADESGKGPSLIATSGTSPPGLRSLLVSSRLTLMSGYRARKVGSNCGSILIPNPIPELRRSIPRGLPDKPVTMSRVFCTSARSVPHRSCNTLPSGVNANRRVDRLSRQIPSSVSNRATPRLTLAFGMPSDRAAAVKPPRAATLSNTRRSFRSIMLAIVSGMEQSVPRSRLERVCDTPLLCLAVPVGGTLLPMGGWSVNRIAGRSSRRPPDLHGRTRGGHDRREC